MQIPESLQGAIAEVLAPFPPAALSAARDALSRRYRQEDARYNHLAGGEEVYAYAAYRMPATYAAVYAAAEHALRSLPACPPLTTLLDVGAGPGTAMWAMADVMPELRTCILLERDADMMSLGQTLAAAAESEALRTARYIRADVTGAWDAPVCDVVTAAYVLNELEEEAMLETGRRLWAHTGELLLIVEPGTPHAHRRMMRLREVLLAEGAHLAAPCPHEGPCPLPEDDWCHAVQRVARTALHRQAKEGSLGYEDEKFAYLAFSRREPERPAARVLRHPQQSKGLVRARLCTADGIREEVISKRDKTRYRCARDWSQGDGEWPPEA